MFEIKKSPELVSANIRAGKELNIPNLSNLYNICKFVLTIIISVEVYSIGEGFKIDENYMIIVLIAILITEVDDEE